MSATKLAFQVVVSSKKKVKEPARVSSSLLDGCLLSESVSWCYHFNLYKNVCTNMVREVKSQEWQHFNRLLMFLTDVLFHQDSGSYVFPRSYAQLHSGPGKI